MNSTFPRGPEQPADRPEKYPESILWTLADAQADHFVFPGNQTNLSRPPMDKALRNEDGSMVNRVSWEVIKSSAKSAIGTHLRKLEADEVTKKYFRTHHTKEWNDAVAYLEIARPIVGLCAGHWKAEHVLSAVLTTERSSMKRAGKKAQKKAQPSDEGEDFGGDMLDDGDGDDDDDDDNLDLNMKKRPAPHLKEVPVKIIKAQHKSKPATKVMEVPTNTKPKTQQQLKTLAVEKDAQRPARLDTKAQSKPSKSISTHVNIRYYVYRISDTSYIT